MTPPAPDLVTFTAVMRARHTFPIEVVGDRFQTTPINKHPEHARHNYGLFIIDDRNGLDPLPGSGSSPHPAVRDLPLPDQAVKMILSDAKERGCFFDREHVLV